MLNMDFSQNLCIETAELSWIASPAPGVWRKPLAREEAERGHATSIVRYEPGASFPSHNHPLGEEILVLSGTFSDETGNFTRGTYFRNPEGFQHSPFSKNGCTILVKLHQFQSTDHARVKQCVDEGHWVNLEAGCSKLLLHQHKSEVVCLYRLQSDASLFLSHKGGGEIFVLSGNLILEELPYLYKNSNQGTPHISHKKHQQYPKDTWVRRAPDCAEQLTAGGETLIWYKSGHIVN
jgi:hypothetical protein